MSLAGYQVVVDQAANAEKRAAQFAKDAETAAKAAQALKPVAPTAVDTTLPIADQKRIIDQNKQDLKKYYLDLKAQVDLVETQMNSAKTAATDAENALNGSSLLYAAASARNSFKAMQMKQLLEASVKNAKQAAAEAKAAHEEALEVFNAKLLQDIQGRLVKLKMASVAAPSQGGGVMANLKHMAEIDTYGIAGALIMEEIFFMLTLFLNPHYNKKLRAYEDAKNTLVYIKNKKTGDLEEFSMAYDEADQPRKVLPPVYPIDDETGLPDTHKDPLLPINITPELVMLNGYQLKPTKMQCLKDAFNAHLVSMHGPDILSQREMLFLYGSANRPDATTKKHDIALDRRIIAGRPAPKPSI